MKTLLIDIETRPTLAYVWELFKVTIGIEQIVKPGGLMCFSAMWLDSDKPLFYADWTCGHRAMVQAAHDLLDEADAVVHYNGQSFDIPLLNTEFLVHKLHPTVPIPQIDLHLVGKSRFRFVSNKLAFVGPYTSIGKKVEHEGFPLWIGCMNGDKECRRKMQEYNEQDTQLLKPLYNVLLPWISNHPNVNMYVAGGCDVPRCTNCGSEHVICKGVRHCQAYSYKRYKCRACGKWLKDRTSLRSEPKPQLIGL